jgi:hypothetical protein
VVGAEDDSVESRLEDLRDRVATKLQGRGELRLRRPGNGWLQVDLLPRSKTAAQASWLEMGDAQIILGVGQRGGRWELGTDEDDLKFLESIIDAVLEGAVVETLAPGRARLVLTLASGERQKTSWAEAPGGCLPLPGWRFWGRTIRYSRYD